MSFQATLEGTEEVAIAVRARLQKSPVYLSALNEVIKGCRTLKEKTSPELAIELAQKISSFQTLAEAMHKKGEFDEEAYSVLKLYETILKEAIDTSRS